MAAGQEMKPVLERQDISRRHWYVEYTADGQLRRRFFAISEGRECEAFAKEHDGTIVTHLEDSQAFGEPFDVTKLIG